MKKIIKFILHRSYDILVLLFVIYLAIYNWGKLGEIALVYTYVLILLLGMLIGFALYRAISRLLYRMNNK